MTIRTARAVVLLAALLLCACGQGTGAATTTQSPAGAATPTSGTRPSSPAVVRIVEPAAGQKVTGNTVHVVVSLADAQIIAATTANIRPDQGHVHVYLDGQLIYMQYSLEKDIPVHPGTYAMKAEFVAGDHVPFNPRVWSETVVFTVA